MSTGSTPAIGLLLGDDSLENENWQKLDRVYQALFRQIIPSSVVVQGDLEVTGNTRLDGTLEVVGPTTLDNSLVVAGNTTLQNLLVEGVMNLPVGAVDGSAITPGTGVFTAQTGVAQTGQLTLTQTFQDIGEIILSPPDDPNRWCLVIATMQFLIGMGADQVSGYNQVMSIRLKRGQATTVVVQTRTGSYTQTRAGYIEIPVTMVRLTKPPVADAPRWAIEAMVINAQPNILITRDFTQLSVVQFL